MQTYREVLPGDVVVKFRPKYDKRWFMFWKYFIQRCICFFTTEWWKSEHTTNVSHAEMVYKQLAPDAFMVIDEEPPNVHFKNRGYDRKAIFRLLRKPVYFDKEFEIYVQKNLGKKYELTKIVVFIFDWVFHTDWFSKHWDLHNYFVCSEFVANFFQLLGRRCSAKEFESTTPDDILDFCLEHPEEFEMISYLT